MKPQTATQTPPIVHFVQSLGLKRATPPPLPPGASGYSGSWAAITASEGAGIGGGKPEEGDGVYLFFLSVAGA